MELTHIGILLIINVYSIPTSGVTYECTRKIYKLLGLPVEHIYSDFTSYDLIDTTKNEEILKELKDMNFDAIIGNPPYGVKLTDEEKKHFKKSCCIFYIL